MDPSAPAFVSTEVKPVGFTTKRLAAIDLPAEIADLAGHVLRLSHTSIRPGGHLALHSHAGRPEIIYMLEGTLTETRCDAQTTLGPGDVLVMSNGIAHALHNRTETDVVYLSITVRIP